MSETGGPKKKAKGRKVDFYLSPEDEYILKKRMEEARIWARGPYLVYLLHEMEEVEKWRMEGAKEAARLIKRFKLRQEEVDTALRMV